MLEEPEGMLNQLPEDLLSCILRRLAPRWLATSRCVCKPWCRIIDTRRMLRSDLFPLSLAGIFVNFHDLFFSELFSHSSTIPMLSDYLPDRSSFINHCNGLLLLEDDVFSNPETPEQVEVLHVVNPATRQWVQLPPSPPPSLNFGSENFNFSQQAYIVFDPTVSPHYEVFLIPRPNAFMCVDVGSFKLEVESTPAIEELEWPLPSCKLHVFSSRTKEWEERLFVREGGAAGTVLGMRLDNSYDGTCHNAVYWQGALYVHCQTNFVMRISLLDGKYQVINPPASYPGFYLGRSQKGVYCALNDCAFSDHYVYMLVESCGKIDWVLKARVSLRNRQTDRPTKPWTLQDANCYAWDDSLDRNGGIMDQKCEGSFDNSGVEIEEWDSDSDDTTETMEQKREGSFDSSSVQTEEWDSEDDDTDETEDWGKGPFTTFLGFHPYKEVVFLCERLSRGLAYHLNSSKVQDLGNMRPKGYGGPCADIVGSFPYTPWFGEFPEHVQESRLWKESFFN